MSNIDDTPSCGQENDWSRAKVSPTPPLDRDALREQYARTIREHVGPIPRGSDDRYGCVNERILADALLALNPPDVKGREVGDIESLRSRLPAYVSDLAREAAKEALSDAEGEIHDSGCYAVARWIDAALSSPVLSVSVRSGDGS